MFGLPMADDLQTLIDDASFDFATGDSEAALAKLGSLSISLPCWQGTRASADCSRMSKVYLVCCARCARLISSILFNSTPLRASAG